MKWHLMSAAEVHKFGIESILAYVQKEGVTVQGVNASVAQNPQIVGTYQGNTAFVFVRTAMYPGKGELSKAEVSRCREWAEQHGAIAFFASVGLACTNYPDRTDVKDDAAMAQPIKNGGFAVSYEGLAYLGSNQQ